MLICHGIDNGDGGTKVECRLLISVISHRPHHRPVHMPNLGKMTRLFSYWFISANKFPMQPGGEVTAGRIGYQEWLTNPRHLCRRKFGQDRLKVENDVRSEIRTYVATKIDWQE
jgi:hypothetical protein